MSFIPSLYHDWVSLALSAASWGAYDFQNVYQPSLGEPAAMMRFRMVRYMMWVD